MPRQDMPDNWEPPVPAWSADFDGTSSLTIAYCGVQSRSNNTAGSEAACALIQSGPDAPTHVERGRFTDAAGFVNQVFVLYWREPIAYGRFAEQSEFARWMADDALLTGDVGVWFEAFHIPTTRFETVFSSQSPAGAARLSEKPMMGPIAEHGYYGSMRDRIPVSDTDDLSSLLDGVGSMRGPTETRGRRLTLAAPENLCLIRSAQDWSSCRGDERDSYLGEVHPVLMKGMKFLSENTIQTGCLACRFIDQLTDEGHPTDKSFAMAYFLDMAQLEAWSKSHPTHLAIFEKFISLAQRLGSDIAIRLWHEVAALDSAGARFEYINCHERTGLLPYAGVQG
jgi:aldoxime dehydratase